MLLDFRDKNNKAKFHPNCYVQPWRWRERVFVTSVASTEPVPGLTTRSQTLHLGWQLSRRRGSQQGSLGTSKNEPNRNCQAGLKDEA